MFDTPKALCVAQAAKGANFRSFALVTFGCKVNQYESHALREAWLERGLVEDHADTADVVLVNTCAVTAKGVADARSGIRRMHRENPAAVIIVTGCAAQTFADEFRRMDGVVLVVPQQEKDRLLQVRPAKDGSTLSLDAKNSAAPHPVPPGTGIPAMAAQRDTVPATQSGEAFPPYSIGGYDRSRAILKVQDGCSHRCTYCIVPLSRGPSRSRVPEDSLAEARRLLEAGFRELVINGINLAHYGRDFSDKQDFWDLVRFLDASLAPEWGGMARLRLSSLEPGQLGQKALEVLGNSVMVAPHIHLSLQSGSRTVLRRMGRGHYDPGTLPDFCQDLRKIFPEYGLGADILTGFPGETDAEAVDTEDFVNSLPFTYAHVFPYSRRPGTPAADWSGQLPGAVKKERAARLRHIFAEKNAAFLRRCLAFPELIIAWEGSATGGVNEFYGECVVTEGAPRRFIAGSLVTVRPVGIRDTTLLVEPLEQYVQ